MLNRTKKDERSVARKVHSRNVVDNIKIIREIQINPTIRDNKNPLPI